MGKSLVNGADAEKAYAAFLQFKDVVKNNQVSSPGPAATVQSGGAIGTAAKKLSDASYPFLKSIDWNSDFEAVNAALGRVVASVPTSTVMDVYNAWAGILSPSVPNKLFSGVNPLEANAAAKAFYEFKDVVKAAQR